MTGSTPTPKKYELNSTVKRRNEPVENVIELLKVLHGSRTQYLTRLPGGLPVDEGGALGRIKLDLVITGCCAKRRSKFQGAASSVEHNGYDLRRSPDCDIPEPSGKNG